MCTEIIDDVIIVSALKLAIAICIMRLIGCHEGLVHYSFVVGVKRTLDFTT